jgi:RNA polymerase sigma-70 factor (ECF subfamily)
LLNEIGWETEQFQRYRPHLEAVAYQMLGSVSEAEDALQEAWLRLGRSRQDTIRNARAWLTTIVGRVCIDMLRARQSRREELVGAFVPEPIVVADEQADPEQQALIADSVGLALLVVLEALSPPERVAYVMHDVFALPFAEIAQVIDRTPEAARQLASRARRRVRGAVPQPDGDLPRQREIVDAFLAASRSGEFEALIAVLDPDVVFRAGGVRGLEQELRGAGEVARSWAALGPRFASGCQPASVNGHPGLLLKTGRSPVGAVGFTISAGLITTIDLILDPAKLENLADAPAAREPGAESSEPNPLSYLRRRPGAVGERIISQALSWPGVSRTDGQFGSVVLVVGARELGHLHGDAVADVPLEPEPRERPVTQEAAHAHEPDPGWTTIPLDTEQGAQNALALLRRNYNRLQATEPPAS